MKNIQWNGVWVITFWPYIFVTFLHFIAKSRQLELSMDGCVDPFTLHGHKHIISLLLYALHWYSRKHGFHVYYTLSNFSKFTPNTWYTKYTFFHVFFSKSGGKKRVIGAEQSVPIQLWVIGVSGKSKSCLGLGYTDMFGTIRCHLKNFWCFLLELFPSFFSVSQWEA